MSQLKHIARWSPVPGFVLTLLAVVTVVTVVTASGPVHAQQDTDDADQPPAPAVDPGRAALEKRVVDLEARLAGISSKVEQSELDKLIEEAQAEAKAPVEEDKPEQRTFLWGVLALQKLNPEISISGDMVASLIIDGDKYYAGRDDRSGMPVRAVSLHLQHVLDPYSMFKAAFHFGPPPDGYADVEEIYITWYGVIPSLSLSVGRFRQNFGVVNRWHEHDLDQVNYPMALEQVLGPEGLNQSGFAVKWFLPPLWAHANELTLEVTDGENETLFAGEFFSVPAALLRVKSYYDLTESTYVELGLTGMVGVNNRRGYPDPSGSDELVDEPWRRTIVLGADLTLQWTPPQQARYRSLTWRSEYYYVNKDTPDDPGDNNRISWGVYSYLDYQLSASWFCGLRFDAALPTIRGPSGDTDIAWDVVPYVTFWQSEFVYLRLQYSHGRHLPHELEDGTRSRRTDNRLTLQINFAAGPHKHEKY